MAKLFEVLESSEFEERSHYIVYLVSSREVIYSGASEQEARKQSAGCSEESIVLSPIE